LQLDALDAIAKQGRVKVVANNLVSNALGTINRVEQLAAWAHEQGAIMVVDAAQAAPHRRIDVAEGAARRARPVSDPVEQEGVRASR
jgi:selenocysteine lyase/cysteine desulfurase